MHESPAIKSNRVDCALYHCWQLGQRLGQPTREALNESLKMGEEGRLEMESRLAPGAARPEGRGVASQKRRPAETEAKEGRKK
jgi:hypothetical protein